VVVTLNDRLDYFGSTVNMAARLQGQSIGADIVLSHTVADDPEILDMLSSRAQRRESVPLKGFTEPVEFVRLLDVRGPAGRQDRGSSADAPQ
jgi:class 3 adenylate cyclase